MSIDEWYERFGRPELRFTICEASEKDARDAGVYAAWAQYFKLIRADGAYLLLAATPDLTAWLYSANDEKLEGLWRILIERGVKVRS